MHTKSITRLTLISLFAFVLTLAGTSVRAQTTSFTYQGLLTDGGNPANGAFDLQFKLFTTLTGGAQQGATATVEDANVSNGVFKVTLDFGAPALSGTERFLEIGVRPGSSTGSFTTLAPRQQLTSSPYAIRTLSAATADSLSAACVNCVTSDQIASVAASQLTGALPVSAIPAGNGNYVQNSTTQQATSNFSISGDGTAGGILSGNIVNATMQYNLGANRLISSGPVAGINNLLVGINAGNGLVDGRENTFIGRSAGQATIGGSLCTNCGPAGYNGSHNTFVGYNAGNANITGFLNSFLGQEAGKANTTGRWNSFFGAKAGANNTTGQGNVMLGTVADFTNSIPLVGFFVENPSEFNTYIGFAAGGASTRRLSTAIGAGAFVACDYCMVLGSSLHTNFKVGIGTDAPNSKLHVAGSTSNDIQVETSGSTNAWARFNMKTANQTWTLGTSNNFNGNQFYLYDFTYGQRRMTIQPNGGIISFPSNDSNDVQVETSGSTNAWARFNMKTANQTWTLGTSQNFNGNQFYLYDFTNNKFVMTAQPISGNVGIGTSAPGFQLHVKSDSTPYMVYGEHLSTATNVAGIAGSSSNGLGVLGTSITKIGVQGSVFSDSGVGVSGVSTGRGTGVSGYSPSGVAVNGDSVDSYGVSGHSSNSFGVYGSSSNSYAGYFFGRVYVTGTLTQNSDIRLKQGVANLGYGLKHVLQLRPVTWTWKQRPDDRLQFGLIAQEVETVLPELVTTEKDAEQTKGINYIGLMPVVIKAIQEQQKEFEQKEAAIKSLKTENAALQQRNAALDARLTALERKLERKARR